MKNIFINYFIKLMKDAAPVAIQRSKRAMTVLEDFQPQFQ